MINADLLKRASKSELIETSLRLEEIITDAESDLRLVNSELDHRSSEQYNYTTKALTDFPRQTSRSNYGK